MDINTGNWVLLFSYSISRGTIITALLQKYNQEKGRGINMDEETILKTYEEKRKQAGEFNLTSDLFAGKVFEDREACQELCRILLQDNKIIIKNVKTQYAIRNLENHSVESLAHQGQNVVHTGFQVAQIVLELTGFAV